MAKTRKASQDTLIPPVGIAVVGLVVMQQGKKVEVIGIFGRLLRWQRASSILRRSLVRIRRKRGGGVHLFRHRVPRGRGPGGRNVEFRGGRSRLEARVVAILLIRIITVGIAVTRVVIAQKQHQPDNDLLKIGAFASIFFSASIAGDLQQVHAA